MTPQELIQKSALSYNGIGRITGLAPSTIMRIAKGETKPDYDTVRRIVEGLGGTVTIALTPTQQAEVKKGARVGILEGIGEGKEDNVYSQN